MKRANRKRLTPKERVEMWQAQFGLCGCGCGVALNNAEGTVGEHRFWFVALGCDEKPDAIYRKPCALKKTNGPRGDINTIAHVKRLAEDRTQYDWRQQNGPKLRGGGKLQTRGFQGWRDFKGNIKSKEPTRG